MVSLLATFSIRGNTIGLDSVFAAVNVVFLETEALIADEAIAITVAAATHLSAQLAYTITRYGIVTALGRYGACAA